jgi:hypothetical protein
MSSHTRGPRKRKSRPSDRRAKASTASASSAEEVVRPRASEARDAAVPVSTTFGERPHAPWHPLPLSELLILAGAIGAAIGLSRGFGGSRLMFAGVAAVALGTIEVTWREHRSGFRSHTLLLSLLPVVVFHSITVLVVAAFTTAPPALNAGLLVLDVALFFLLFKLLRARFLDARARAAARR